MKLFDLHCDTIVELKKRGEDFLNCTTQFSLREKGEIQPFVQTMAIFIPDDVRGEAALNYVDTHSRYLDYLAEKHRNIAEVVTDCKDIRRITESGKCALVRSLESGAALGGDLDNIDDFVTKGFKMMTLVWNGENELGSGHNTKNGLTDFGKAAVKRMESAGLIVDCSHLNDQGFDQLCEIAEKPFIATHSNSRAVCGHRRNLRDDQFKEIVQRRGLVGLNLYLAFLSDEMRGDVDMLFRHVYHFLEIGGEDVLACGSDFDGAVIDSSLNSPYKFAGTAKYFVDHGVSEAVVEKIFFGNTMRFFEENVK